MIQPGQERRKYLRVETPLNVRVIFKDNTIFQATTKDISPVGLRLEISGRELNINEEVELAIEIPNNLSAVHAKGKVVWKKKLSTSTGTPVDIGCEFTRVEEDNKNTFLKYFCDLLHEQAKMLGEETEAQS